MPADPDPTNPIQEQALRFLGRRAYSCGELTARLVAKGHDPALVDTVIRRLVGCGLLDDEAYARAVADATVQKKPAAAALIHHNLEARHIPPAIAERVATEVLADVDPVEAAGQLARDLLAARPGGSARTIRQRIGAALARRGFDADIIGEALERAGLAPLSDESFDQEP